LREPRLSTPATRRAAVSLGDQQRPTRVSDAGAGVAQAIHRDIILANVHHGLHQKSQLTGLAGVGRSHSSERDLAADPAAVDRVSPQWQRRLGGFYRTLAYSKASSGATSFTVSRWNGSAAVTVTTITLAPNTWGQVHYLSAGPGWAMGKVSGPANAPVGISGLMTNVAPRAQENPLWCWAATAQMAISNLADPPEQCDLARDHFNDNTCCVNVPGCDKPAETSQALKEAKYAFNRGVDVTDVLALTQALQSGPVVVHQFMHYTLLTDYTEVIENGVWVPYGLKFNPEPRQNYDLEDEHMSWVKLKDVDLYGDDGQSEIHSRNRANLVAAISRVSFDSGTTTIFFDAPGATSFMWEVYDGGLASGNGALWHSGTVNYNDTASTMVTGTKATFTVGDWVWYNVRVKACANGSCGVWANARSVSKRPSVVVDSLTWANNVLTAKFTASAASPETTFRYRVIDDGSALKIPWRVAQVAGTPSRFGSSATVTFGIGSGLATKVQVQACNQNGCSAWQKKSLYTGS
jgi:hypothetical protein